MSQGRWTATRDLLRRKAVRRLLMVLVIGAALALLAPKARRVAGDWSRDEVRRRATDALAAASGGRVELGDAVIVSLREVRLRSVRLTDMSAHPEIASLVIEEAVLVPGAGENVTGSWSSIESISVTGAVLTLRRLDAAGTPPSRAPTTLRIGRMIVKDAMLLLDGAAGIGALGVEGEVRDIGGDMSGEAAIRSHRVPLRGALEALLPPEDRGSFERVLAWIEPCCGALEASLRLQADGSLELDGGIEIPEGSIRGEPAARGSFRARAEQPDEKGTRVVLASFDVPGLASGSALLARSRQGTSWTEARLALARLTPAMLRDAAPEGLAWSEASVEAVATPAASDGSAGVVIDARAKDVRVGDDLRFADLRVRAEGLAHRPAGFEGEARISVGDVEELTLRGSATLDEAATASLTFELEAGALARHPGLLRVAGAPPDGAQLLRHDAVRGRLDVSRSAPQAGATRWKGDIDRTRFAWRFTAGDREARVDLEVAASAASGRPGDPPSWRAEGVVSSPALPGLVRFQASDPAGRATPLAASGSVEGLDARAVLGLLAPSLTRDDIPATAALGAVDGDFTATRDASGEWTSEADLRLSGLSAQSADFTRALSLPGVPLALRARLAADGALEVSASADVAQGQILWGAAFADLARLTPRVEATFRAPPGDGAWDAEIAASAAGDMAARARLRPVSDREGIEGDLALEFPDVAAAWRALGDSGLLAVSPALGGFTPGGSARVALAGFDGSPGSALDATVTVERGTLAHGPSGLRLEGLATELPLRFERDAGDAPWRLAAGARAGRIRAGSVEVLGARAERVDVPVVARADGLRVGADVAFAVLGGRAVLEGVTLEKPLAPERALSAGLALTGLRLEELGPVGPFRLAGSISANLPRVSASATRLDVQGGALIRAWGGEIAVDEISGENPWSRFPRTRIAATFRDIDLLELTSTFGFGAMTGLVEGEIRSFELLGSTPVRFDASVRSAEGDEPRSISIPALQNLATLATGGRAPLFDKGLLKLVGRLRYEELGARATLQADEFMLRGLAERNGRELFLKGRLPLRVDVANAEPGATVSFRAMMNRLQGLEEPDETPR